MTFGRRQAEQKRMRLSYDQLPQSQGHVFYERLQKLLHQKAFDAFLEKLCAPFYAEKLGRRSIPPGRSFRMLMIGCFGASTLGPASAGAARDAPSLQEFLGLAPGESVPAHSSLCCTFWKKPVCCMAKIRERRLCHGGERGHEAARAQGQGRELSGSACRLAEASGSRTLTQARACGL